MTRPLSRSGARTPRITVSTCVFASLAAIGLLLPEWSYAQEPDPDEDDTPSAREIITEMNRQGQEMSRGVNRILATHALLGPEVGAAAAAGGPKFGQHREKVYCELPNGETRVEWRDIDPREVEARKTDPNMVGPRSESQRAGDASAEATKTSEKLRRGADMMGAAGAWFNEGLEGEGVPVGLLSLIGAAGPIQWGGFVEDDAGGLPDVYYFNVLNPGSYFGGYALFLNALADGVDMVNSLRFTAAEHCKEQLATDEAMSSEMKNMGRTQVGDRTAWQLEAQVNETVRIAGGLEPHFDDAFAGILDPSASRPTANPANLAGPRNAGTVEGTEFTVKKATLQVDTEFYVPLLVRIEGIVTEDGQPKPLPVIIEKEYRSYRLVPDTEMLLPYLEVMRIWGFQDLGPEMEEAQREMAKLKAELAKLPPKDRAMAERMMGDRIKQMEAMAEGGAIVVENRIEEIVVNPDLPHNPTSATNPIVLECMPGDADCVEPDLATAETTGDGAATDADSDPATTQD